MRTFSKEEKKHILIIYRKLKETLFPLIISKINEKPGPRKKIQNVSIIGLKKNLKEKMHREDWIILCRF